MPAAAVIPALVAYIKVVAVKKLVVDCEAGWGGTPNSATADPGLNGELAAWSLLAVTVWLSDYCEKIRVFKAGIHGLNTLAWNNRIGSEGYFVGFGWLREWLTGTVGGISI